MARGYSDENLRLLYLDWCSTQVAKRFLDLSLDEVWLRSQFAASLPSDSEEPRALERGSNVAIERIPGYLELVRKTALVLAQEMNLPSFDEWRDDYLKNPGDFQKEILGQ